MSAKVTLDVKGLVLSPGELSRANGALIRADNLDVSAPGVIRSRQGHLRQSVQLGGPVWKIASTKELSTNVLANYGSNSAAATLKYGDGGSWTLITGTYANQAGTRMQTAVGRRNHYVTADDGVHRIESDMTGWLSGMPQGLGLDLRGPTAILVRAVGYNTQTGNYTVGQVATRGGATGTIRADSDGGTAGVLYLSGISGTFAAGTMTDPLGGSAQCLGAQGSGFLADASSCAYRVTWCKKDAQGVVMEGSPGDRRVVYNNTRTSGWVTGISQDVLCRMPIPTQAQTTATALTTAYFWRLYRSAQSADGVPDDNMRLVGEGYLTAGNLSAGYVEFVDAAPEAYRDISPVLYTNDEDDFGEDGVGGPGIAQANDFPPRARDVALFAGCMFYSDLHFTYNQSLTLLSVVAGVGLTAGDTLTIGGITYTAHASVTSNNQFVVVTSTGPTDSTNGEAIERTAQNLVNSINTSTTNTTVWAFYERNPEGLPGVIRLEARANATSFTSVASAHGNAYRPSIASAVTATADIFANGYAFSKPNQPDAVPPINVGQIGRDDTANLRMQVLGDSIFFFTDAGIYRLSGRSFADFAVQEFDLSFRLIGRELVTVCDDAIYAWGREGIARITAAGVQYISNGIEPLLWAKINTLGLTWLASFGWAAAYGSRHKVVFAVPDTNAPSGSIDNTRNCPTFFVYDTRMQAWTRYIMRVAGDVARTAGYSCGAVRVYDDILYFGQWLAAGGDCWVFSERLAYTTADFKDDTYDGTDLAITKTVQWNCATSSPELETHWDELHVLFDVSSVISAWTTPTALTAQFTADLASASSAISLAPTAASRMSRCLVPQAQRRSARMTVGITHSTASEYFGLEGMVLVHLPGEGVATTRT